MIEVMHTPKQELVTIRASGTLSEADYDRTIPEIEEAIRKPDGALNSVIDVIGLEGIKLGALWKDLQFDFRHFSYFKRIAIVGETLAKESGAKASTLLTGAEVRFFDGKTADSARQWAVGR